MVQEKIKEGEEKRRGGPLLAGCRGEDLNHQPHLQQSLQRAARLLEQEGQRERTSLSLNGLKAPMLRNVNPVKSSFPDGNEEVHLFFCGHSLSFSESEVVICFKDSWTTSMTGRRERCLTRAAHRLVDGPQSWKRNRRVHFFSSNINLRVFWLTCFCK